MKFLKWSLYPFSVLYGSITSFRNHLYDIGHFKSFEFQTNVISVGNLSVGGTGKTPMVEYLIRLLAGEKKLATLSRGYGRKTKGFLQGDPATTKVTDIGDEPFQYLLKFSDKVNIFVGEERAWAIPQILYEKPDTEVILLDDAYQHRSVKPSFSILLTTYDYPFYDDYLMPMGRLREAVSGLQRADVIVVTKCPQDFSEEALLQKIGQYNIGSKPVFFTSVKYGEVSLFNGKGNKAISANRVILVSGIAQADDFEQHCRRKYDVIEHLRFGDHHHYRLSDIEKITNKANTEGVILLTTEKDFVKLREFKKELGDLPSYYLPIEIVFKDNKNEFDELVRKSIKSYDTPEGEHE
ncbi:MAG: tetraacyldisaccharide 4'-kinase [Cyclobacteriaceae bacterium]